MGVTDCMPPLMAQRSLRRTKVEEIQLTGTDASTQTAPVAMKLHAGALSHRMFKAGTGRITTLL
eukprot:1845684-Prymnesium_polylepis.1